MLPGSMGREGGGGLGSESGITLANKKKNRGERVYTLNLNRKL
jgi:hypothetical protein